MVSVRSGVPGPDEAPVSRENGKSWCAPIGNTRLDFTPRFSDMQLLVQQLIITSINVGRSIPEPRSGVDLLGCRRQNWPSPAEHDGTVGGSSKSCPKSHAVGFVLLVRLSQASCQQTAPARVQRQLMSLGALAIKGCGRRGTERRTAKR